MAKGYGSEIYLNTANKAAPGNDQCQAKLDPVVRYRRATRKDGTTYMGRYLSGDPCPNRADVTLPGAPARKRCLAHISQT